ncbi:hypothetical protein MTO96_014026 [Rhipicephalus appendiculatus]
MTSSLRLVYVERRCAPHCKDRGTKLMAVSACRKRFPRRDPRTTVAVPALFKALFAIVLTNDVEAVRRTLRPYQKYGTCQELGRPPCTFGPGASCVAFLVAHTGRFRTWSSLGFETEECRMKG